MKIYLEPKGWPTNGESAPSGLLVRLRKGKVILYFKIGENIYDMDGNQVAPSGLVQSIAVKTEMK